MPKPSPGMIGEVRRASRRLVRELGFMQPTLAGTALSASGVHAIIEIGSRGSLTATELSEILGLEKSSVSRLLMKLIQRGELRENPIRGDARVKSLKLTKRGRQLLRSIDEFATCQVSEALEPLLESLQRSIVDGLRLYAQALEARRRAMPFPRMENIEINHGYLTGVVGRIAEMHARFYSDAAGFGQYFESKVASDVAGFASRLTNRKNLLCTATQSGVVIASVAIDSEDIAPGIAHLRWFLVDERMRGNGIGRRLLGEAVTFCDRQRFPETHLWTFRGLDAARSLYEAFDFVLAEERSGRQWGKEVVEQRFVRPLRDPERGVTR